MRTRLYLAPFRALLFMLVLGLLFSKCAEEESGHPVEVNQKDPVDLRQEDENSGCESLIGQKTIRIDDVSVDVIVPRGRIRGDLLLLPRWNGTKSEWCLPLNLCRKARRMGYRLIMPEMSKSLYASQYFPETRPDWRRYPTMAWVCDTLIPELQNDYCLLKEGRRNFLVGIATGARGAVLLTMRKPGLFTAVAALSGDYDQTRMTTDNLMRGVYGNYEDFPGRWRGLDNPLRQAIRFNSPLYLSHGREDEVVPFQQSRSFYEAVRSHHPGLNVELALKDDMHHDTDFWSFALGESLDFFDRFQSDKGAERQ